MIFESFQLTDPQYPPHPDALVCVVDDDDSVRSGLERVFRSAKFRVETFSSVARFLDRRPHSGPVCLVVDVEMPELGGFDLQKMLHGRSEQIVFLTGHGDVPMCASAMKAGAVDFLTKPADDELLLSAVARALNKARDLRARHCEQDAARGRLDSLTEREFQVMELVIAGLLNKQIAAKLGIAEKTVKIHRGRVMRKTGSVSVPDLMRVFIDAGCTTRPGLMSSTAS